MGRGALRCQFSFFFISIFSNACTVLIIGMFIRPVLSWPLVER